MGWGPRSPVPCPWEGAWALPSLTAPLSTRLPCREKKGFGSESKRFGDSEKDVPGPGKYLEQAPSLEYTHESISKKGYGPMTSSSRRWRGVRPVYSGPGPGEFSSRSALEVEQDKYFNRAPTTAAFHPPVRPGMQAAT